MTYQVQYTTSHEWHTFGGDISSKDDALRYAASIAKGRPRTKVRVVGPLQTVKEFPLGGDK
jgi:hypothetical protein